MRSFLRGAEEAERFERADRLRYEACHDVTHLLCLVVDHEGRLRNPRALEKDLKQSHGDSRLAVTVRIHDR